MDEFSFIEKYLQPLTFGKADALNLKDDAAIIPNKPGYDTVITKDAIAEGTHFFKGDDPAKLARKLVRVNISDLAAKGATPYCCFLALALPKNTTEAWLKAFASGLHDDFKEFGCFLGGGDTVVHDGPLVLTLTAIGHAPHGKAILRNGAAAEEIIFITGTIGDSYLGLQHIKNSGNLSGGEKYTERYYIPQPRLSVGLQLHNIASACIDVSDGLIADITHICECSKIGAELELGKIPLSPIGKEAANFDKNFLLKAITGGDDYELLFTAPVGNIDKITKISHETGVPITQIGKITAGNKVDVLDESGNFVEVKNSGYKHPLG